MQGNQAFQKTIKTKPSKQQTEKPKFSGKQWKREDKRKTFN